MRVSQLEELLPFIRMKYGDIDIYIVDTEQEELVPVDETIVTTLELKRIVLIR